MHGPATTQAICLADILKFILGSEVREIKPNHMQYSLLNLKMISFLLFPGLALVTSPGGGGVLPYISHIGMCRPLG